MSRINQNIKTVHYLSGDCVCLTVVPGLLVTLYIVTNLSKCCGLVAWGEFQFRKYVETGVRTFRKPAVIQH